LVKEKIPGYDFDAFHLPIFHHEELCLPGDIFAHENAKKYQDLHKVERKYSSAHQDVQLDEEEGHEEWNDSLEHDDNDMEEDTFLDMEEDPTDIDEHEGEEHEGAY
jgi:hypothetical protein